jgi:hypothetical protein
VHRRGDQRPVAGRAVQGGRGAGQDPVGPAAGRVLYLLRPVGLGVVDDRDRAETVQELVVGTGTSVSSMTSGPPNALTVIACIAAPLRSPFADTRPTIPRAPFHLL